MSNIIKIKRGLKANLANSGTNEGELKYATDTNELFIYSDGENKLLSGIKEDKQLDWDNYIEFTSPFTAPSDGYFTVRLSSSHYVKVNNVEIGSVGSGEETYICFFVNKDNIITTNGNKRKFIPYL